MRKFLINVYGNSYEVEVEEINAEGTSPRPVTTSTLAPRPTPTVQAPVVQPVVSKPVVETPQAQKSEVAVSEGQEVVEAPMPGNIWKVLVSEGDMVKSGDVLLILEAMKMENEILAPRDGKVVSVTTSEGSNVNTGEKLVVIE
ncbi:MAG: DUF2118 domain-containing protein [Tissierella sp.]|nr:DUF2118 domain-containing protein [Tissierella sp.]